MKNKKHINRFGAFALLAFILCVLGFAATTHNTKDSNVAMAALPVAFLTAGALNNDGKQRLKALIAKGDANLTADEKTEMSDLQKQAQTDGYDPAKDEAPLSDEAVKSLVETALGKVLGEKGLSTDAIAAEVKKALPQGVTADAVQAAVAKALEGKTPDAKALAAEVAKALPAGITAEAVKGIVEEAVKTHARPASQHEFPVGIELPIAHRAGNLSVAQKQLLNVCLMHVSDEVFANGKTKRPANMNEGITDAQLSKAVSNGERAVKSMQEEARFGRKAITATGSGTGLELMNVDISSDLQARLYLTSQLAAALVASEINMPSNPFKLPMTTTRPQFFVGSEGGTPDESTPGSAQPTLDAKKLIGFVQYSYEADEDSIVAILPTLQSNLASGAADALEGAFINGDTAGTHQDSDIAAVTRHGSKLFNGLRKLSLAVAALKKDLSTGGVSASNIKVLRKALGKYGMRPQDLIIVCGTNAYNELVALPETLTAEKAGGANRAGILTGVAPSIYGIDIIPSSQCREDLNASGVYDGTTTTKGSILLVHRPSWIVGVRRGFTVEVFVDKIVQMNKVIASFRRDFIPLETPSAAQSIVAAGFNYTP